MYNGYTKYFISIICHASVYIFMCNSKMKIYLLSEIIGISRLLMGFFIQLKICYLFCDTVIVHLCHFTVCKLLLSFVCVHKFLCLVFVKNAFEKLFYVIHLVNQDIKCKHEFDQCNLRLFCS